MNLITQPLDILATLSNIPPNMKFVDKRPNSTYITESSEIDERVKKFLDRYPKVILISEGTRSEYSDKKIMTLIEAIEGMRDYGFIILLKT